MAAVTTLLIAALGATITVLGPWYQDLAKPAWAPPDILFGPAWTLIFGLCAISAATAWLAAPSQTMRDVVIGLFAINGFLNLLWSFLFFRMQRPDLSATEVWFLWASIALLIIICWRFSRPAALLLIPYLIWVTFAGALNIAIVQLNGPF
ncbi:TspO/MBR family protein [Polymorphobacter fuscus]|uniref:TspO/MBR family protein n=1 Tax=Sandarakinorhabdus fusca TaxID=1439888 RepID=UPI00311CDD68